MGTKKDSGAMTGQALLDKVRPTLLALSADEVAQPNIDLQSAAMAALVLIDRARQGDRPARFALLPTELFAKGTLDALEDVANAVLHIEVEAAREGAVTSNVKVDVALVQEATELRERMLKTAEYNLGDREAVARELADIRAGTGYLDLANDCARLAAVYVANRRDLASDKRHYDADDAALATTLGAKIRNAYRAAASRSGEISELRPRAFTELLRLYDEVRDAAHFLFRSQPAVLGEFATLRAAAKAVGPTRRGKRAEPLAPPSPVNGDGSSVPAGGSA